MFLGGPKVTVEVVDDCVVVVVLVVTVEMVRELTVVVVVVEGAVQFVHPCSEEYQQGLAEDSMAE